MPIYTVYHSHIEGRLGTLKEALATKERERIAAALTNLHTEVTGAPQESVKVFFLPLEALDYFSGGTLAYGYVRVIAQIRQGISDEQKMRLLKGMYETVKAAKSAGKLKEIQTQIVEIDDMKTVMTNGVLNAP